MLISSVVAAVWIRGSLLFLALRADPILCHFSPPSGYFFSQWPGNDWRNFSLSLWGACPYIHFHLCNSLLQRILHVDTCTYDLSRVTPQDWGHLPGGGGLPGSTIKCLKSLIWWQMWCWRILRSVIFEHVNVNKNSKILFFFIPRFEYQQEFLDFLTL